MGNSGVCEDHPSDPHTESSRLVPTLGPQGPSRYVVSHIGRGSDLKEEH